MAGGSFAKFVQHRVLILALAPPDLVAFAEVIEARLTISFFAGEFVRCASGNPRRRHIGPSRLR